MNMFDAACEFPWPHGMFGHLGRYILLVDQTLEISHALQEKAIITSISDEIDPVAIGEWGFQLERLNKEDWWSNQRLLWGGLLVSIYATFEQALGQIFDHCHKVANMAVFVAKSREDFISAASRYSTETIGIPLFKFGHERECLNELRILRRCFVHQGGKYGAIPPQIWSTIQSKRSLGFPLKVNDKHWCADAFAARHYWKVANDVSRQFSSKVFDRLVAS